MSYIRKKTQIVNNAICKSAITTTAAPYRPRGGTGGKSKKLMRGRPGSNFRFFRRHPSPSRSARSCRMTIRQTTTCLCLFAFPGPLKFRKESHAPPAPHPFPCCRVSLNRVGEAVNNKSARFFFTLRTEGGCAFNQMFLFAAPSCSRSCLLVQLFVRPATPHIGCHDISISAWRSLEIACLDETQAFACVTAYGRLTNRTSPSFGVADTSSEQSANMRAHPN